jgi:pimeloyl-ACP methyl ester carboxylesterase
MLKIGLIALAVLVGLGAAAAVFFYRNTHYDGGFEARLRRAGFSEKQARLPDGTVLNYGEGPGGGPALLLIHGQTVSWRDYAKVLPALSKRFHVYAVDCHGHGGSSKDPAKYTALAMGRDFKWFLEHVVQEKAYVSGHSSGGLLAAWLAAEAPERILGAVLEDPPFFSTEAVRNPSSFAWVDSFQTIHGFLNQQEERNYTRYYLEHCYMQKLIGKGWTGMRRYVLKALDRYPGKPPRIFFLPPSVNRMFDMLNGDYDLRFGDAFYDNRWFDGYDREKLLSAIRCPSVLIHTGEHVSPDGILLAAQSDEDAQRAHRLIPENQLIKVDSGHDFHWEKPRAFAHLMADFLDKTRRA